MLGTGTTVYPTGPARNSEARIAYGTITDGPPEHLGVGGMVGLVRNDMQQLVEEIAELRARLNTILAQKPEVAEGKRMPALAKAHCEIGVDLEGIHDLIKTAREIIYHTITELDL